MRYILEVSESGKPDALVAKLAAATAGEVKEDIVTAADQLREQGIERRRQQECTASFTPPWVFASAQLSCLPWMMTKSGQGTL